MFRIWTQDFFVSDKLSSQTVFLKLAKYYVVRNRVNFISSFSLILLIIFLSKRDNQLYVYCILSDKKVLLETFRRPGFLDFGNPGISDLFSLLSVVF